MKKIIMIILAVALSTTILAGCSSTDSTKDTTDNTSDTSNGTEGEAENEDKSEGEVLSVGTNAEFPPFEYVDDNGEPDGFDMALIREIGKRIGMEVTVDNMEFSSLISSIGSKIDVAIAGMTVTEEREKTVDFSDSYYTAVQYVILPADSTIVEAKDLENKKIGVQLGTTGDLMTEEIAGAEAAQYNKAVDAVNDLINGRVDLVIIDKNPALVFEGKFDGQVVAVDGDQFGFEPEDYAIALPKGNTELKEKINTALKEIKDDGTYDELVATYIEQ